MNFFGANIHGRGKPAVRIRPSDFTEWDASTVVDDQPTGDGDYFWHNPQAVGIRASLHWTGTAYSIETVDGREYFRLYIDPDTPDAGPGNNNYRAEIEESVTNKPLSTIRMLGSGFMFPYILNHDEEIALGQWKSGTGVGGPYANNHPVIYIGLAAAGQTDQFGDSSVENEIVVINKVVDIEGAGNGRTNTGIVIAAGTEYFMRQYIKGGTLGTGYYRLDLKVGRGGSWSTIYEETESTAWNLDADGGSISQVTPYWTTGIYAQGIRTDVGAAAEKSLNGGTYNITMFLLDKIKRACLLDSDPLYATPVSTLIEKVDTSI